MLIYDYELKGNYMEWTSDPRLGGSTFNHGTREFFQLLVRSLYLEQNVLSLMVMPMIPCEAQHRNWLRITLLL